MATIKTHIVDGEPVATVDSFHDDTNGLRYLVENLVTGDSYIYEQKSTALDVAQALHNRARRKAGHTIVTPITDRTRKVKNR